MFPLINFIYASCEIYTIAVLLWGFSLVLKNVTMVDSFWPLMFIFMALFQFWYAATRSIRVYIATGMVLVWGIRLAAYMIYRNHIKTNKEDKRYADLRKMHGDRFWWYSLLNPFLVQASVMLLVSICLCSIFDPKRVERAPVFLATWPDYAALALFTVGFACETLADLQMQRFKQNPQNKGQICKDGLWRFTRHPNYFGDACVWTSIFLLSFSQGAYWTLVSPVVMTLVLVKGTGMEMTDQYMLRDYGSKYREYMEETSGFIPMAPKKEGEVQQHSKAH